MPPQLLQVVGGDEVLIGKAIGKNVGMSGIMWGVDVVDPQRQRDALTARARQHLMLLRPRREDDHTAEQRLDVDVLAAVDGRGMQPEAAARARGIPVCVEVAQDGLPAPGTRERTRQ